MNRRATLGVAALAVALAGAGVALTPRETGAAGGTGQPPGAPVTAEKAGVRDMPVYVRGIGTVQAFNSVLVKSRVDGQVMKVDFTEGQEVKAGDLLYELDPRPFQAALGIATAAKQKDEAQLVSATADLKRDEALVAHSYQTQQAYDQQKSLVAQVRAAIASDAAQIEAANLNLTYSQIRAPIAGRTGARNVDIGNLVKASDNQALVTINQLRPIYASLTAPQADLPAIRQSAKRAAIKVEAYAADGKTALGLGAVSLIDNQIDQASGTIHLKAQFANDDELLWPGQFVNLRLVVDVLKNAVTVPARALQQGPNGPYLFVVKDDMTAEVRDVTVAETENDVAAIAKGLAAGELVVVDGQYRLDNGTRVSLRPASDAPQAAAATDPQ